MVWFKKGWMKWEKYKSRITFLDLFRFQQNCRKQNINSLSSEELVGGSN